MTTRPRVLVVGATGMLGHKLCQALGDACDVYGTVRAGAVPVSRILAPERTITGVEATDFDTVEHALEAVAPTVVVNCIGIVKQAQAMEDARLAIAVNALFPHELRAACAARDMRLIHISTDCVFSGAKDAGRYREDDRPDPVDLYGRSKLLGEVDEPGVLTLRTSFIGRELSTANGLVEWFLTSRGTTVRGFRRAFFSGLTTNAMAALVIELIERHPRLDGVLHVSGDRIAKYALLQLLREAFEFDVEIVPDDTVKIDRSLDSSRLRAATGWSAPSWPEMVSGLVADPTPYDELRSVRAHG